MKEPAAALHGELVDSLDDLLGRRGRVDVAVAAGHGRLHVTRMHDADRNALRREITGERNRACVQGGLAHAVTEVAARAVVRDGPHAAREEHDFRARAQSRQEPEREKNRADGVDLKLVANAFDTWGELRFAFEDACILHKNVNACIVEVVEHPMRGVGGRDVDPLQNGQVPRRRQRIEFRRRAAAKRVNVLAALKEVPNEFEADTAIGAGDNNAHTSLCREKGLNVQRIRPRPPSGLANFGVMR